MGSGGGFDGRIRFLGSDSRVGDFVTGKRRVRMADVVFFDTRTRRVIGAMVDEVGLVAVWLDCKSDLGSA